MLLLFRCPGVLTAASGPAHRSDLPRSRTMDYVVVGAGAIGGTIAARLVRDGRAVLVCDADAEHVAAIEADGLRIEGPVEQLTVRVPAVTPDALPERLGTVLLAVKAH